MYFVDRLSLGKRMAVDYQHLASQEVVLVSLKETSLLTAISMAIDLRAWIYPLEYEVIQDPRDASKVLGAVTIEGEFCLNPEISEYEYEGIKMDFFGVMEDRKREAVQRLNARLMQNGAPFDKHLLNGRHIIVLADILSSSVELEVMNSMMKPLRPMAIYGSVGNVTVDISDRFRLTTDKSTVLDVLPNIMNDDHYFEQQDAYSLDEKRLLARNIQTYWTTA